MIKFTWLLHPVHSSQCTRKVEKIIRLNTAKMLYPIYMVVFDFINRNDCYFLVVIVKILKVKDQKRAKILFLAIIPV